MLFEALVFVKHGASSKQTTVPLSTKCLVFISVFGATCRMLSSVVLISPVLALQFLLYWISSCWSLSTLSSAGLWQMLSWVSSKISDLHFFTVLSAYCPHARGVMSVSDVKNYFSQKHSLNFSMNIFSYLAKKLQLKYCPEVWAHLDYHAGM